MLVVDVETKAIGEPGTRPEPVGVAVWELGRAPEYLAFAHPSGNNSTHAAVRERLARNWNGPVLTFNALFDLGVIEEHLDLPWPVQYHDAMVAAFLHDPRLRDLSLKGLGDDLLGEESLEQDALHAWIHDNIPSAAGQRSRFGQFIGNAPGNIVAPYAIQDVLLTRGLFDLLKPGGRAYERECALLRVLYWMEKDGVRVDQERLTTDLPRYEEALFEAEAWIAKRLGISANDLSRRQVLATALERGGLVRDLEMTNTGQRSVGMESIRKNCSNPDVVAVLIYREKIRWALQTCLRKWAECGGRLHYAWRSTMGDSTEGGRFGARTGRITSKPNAQNLTSKLPQVGFDDHAELRLPAALRRACGALPNVRNYLIAEAGEVLIGADFASQELRIAAQFENGPLAEAFRAEPTMDPHTFIRDLIAKKTGREISRSQAKTITFATLYGSGDAGIAKQLGISADEAGAIRSAYRNAMSGLLAVDKYARSVYDAGDKIVTLGGRAYSCEAPKIENGRLRTFSYKALNVLVQGSAADLTKQAMLDYALESPRRLRFSIHDELVASVPSEAENCELEQLVGAMERAAANLGCEPAVDVPFVAEGRSGRSLAELKG